MELRHLRYFAAVAETRHFGRAAEQLHLAQPALSQSIRQLEARLGTQLLTRTTRHVALTPAGEFLYDEAQRILGAVDDSVRGVRRLAEGRTGLVRIAFTGTAAFTELPRMARAVTKALPGVALEIKADALTPTQLDGLRDGSIDVGVLRPPVDGDDLELRTITIEPLVLATPADHRLAGQESVEMADLRGEGFIGYTDQNSAVNSAVRDSCKAAGFTARKQHEAPGTASLLALVSAGLGIALVPAAVRTVPLQGVRFVDVVDAATVELACAWRRDSASPAVLAVLACFEQAGIFADSPAHSEIPPRSCGPPG